MKKRIKIFGRKQTVELIREGNIPEGAYQIEVGEKASTISNEECFDIIEKAKGYETRSAGEALSEHPTRIYYIVKG